MLLEDERIVWNDDGTFKWLCCGKIALIILEILPDATSPPHANAAFFLFSFGSYSCWSLSGEISCSASEHSMFAIPLAHLWRFTHTARGMYTVLFWFLSFVAYNRIRDIITLFPLLRCVSVSSVYLYGILSRAVLYTYTPIQWHTLT